MTDTPPERDLDTELAAAQLEWTQMQIRNEPWRIGISLAGLVIASAGAGAIVTTLVLRLTGALGGVQ